MLPAAAQRLATSSSPSLPRAPRTTRAPAAAKATAVAAPWALGLAGTTYGVIALVSSAIFVGLTIWVVLQRGATPAEMKAERFLFVYSIGYILLIFATLAIDRLTA